jgi:outer membrane protein
MKTLFLTIVALAVTASAFAQSTLKIGHINSQELILAMPENDSAQVKIEKVAKDLQNQFQTIQNEYTNKYKDFMSKKDSYSELIRQTKSSELQEIEQWIQQFQQTAEQELQSQRLNIYKPVLDKANNAISQVAKSNGFTYILDLAQGGVIYYDETSTDILPLVKQKLGLPDKPKSVVTNSAIKR